MGCVLQCLASVLCGDDLLEQLTAPRSSGMSVSPHITIPCMELFSGPLHCHHTDLKQQRAFLFPKSQQGTDEERVPCCCLSCLIESCQISASTPAIGRFSIRLYSIHSCKGFRFSGSHRRMGEKKHFRAQTENIII